MRDIILDFETLDTKDTAIVPSIGATVCNLETGEYGERFHVKLDVQEQIDAGFTFSADTLAFWMKQQEAGRNYLIEILDKKTVTVSRKQGFAMLYQFIRNVPNAFVWGNGATFDLGICIREYGQNNLPWQFWGEQDVRSIVSFCKRVFGVEFKKDTEFEGVQHNPVDDANHEAAYLMRYFEYGRELATGSAIMAGELHDLRTELQQAREILSQPAPTPDTASLEAIAKEQREVSELRQALDKAHARILELESPAALNPLDELTDETADVDAEPEAPQMERWHVVSNTVSELFCRKLEIEHNIVIHSNVSSMPTGVKPVAMLYPHLAGIGEELKRGSEERGIPVVAVRKEDYDPERDAEFGTNLRRRIVAQKNWLDSRYAIEEGTETSTDTQEDDAAPKTSGLSVYFIGELPERRIGKAPVKQAYLEFSDHISSIADDPEDADVVIALGAVKYAAKEIDMQYIVNVDHPLTEDMVRIEVDIWEEWLFFIADYCS